MKPGVYTDMPSADYAALDALSATFLRDMLATTPLKAKQLKEAGRPDSEAKAFGRALHCCVLEPERFEREVAVMPEFKGEGSRQLRAEWILRNAGKIQVKPKVLEHLLAMRDAVMRHEVARRLMTCNGRNEVSAIWEEGDVRAKIRMDRFYCPEGSTVGCVLDLKSTRNAQEDFFRYDVRQYGYDVEACFFLRVLDLVFYPVVRPFHFVAVEKIEPYRVEVYELTRAERTLGHQKVQKALEVYAECRRTGEWPDVPIFGAREGVA